jgi:porphobilinogen deaminase
LCSFSVGCSTERAVLKPVDLDCHIPIGAGGTHSAARSRYARRSVMVRGSCRFGY